MVVHQNADSLTIPFSAACERNKDPILEGIARYLQKAASVLEIGSGTGQHAVYFSGQYPRLEWQTSDQQQYCAGIAAQLVNAKSDNAELKNLHAPIVLDVNVLNWLAKPKNYDIIYSANTMHIMAWSDVQAFFKGLSQVSHDKSLLCVYGPFKYQGKFTSHSNHQFDQSLRSRGVGSAIRDFEAVNELAIGEGFELIEDIDMPANNQCLIWRRTLNST